MGNRKAGYVRDEAGNRVEGQGMGGGFGEDPIPRAIARNPEPRAKLAGERRLFFANVDALQQVDWLRAVARANVRVAQERERERAANVRVE